MTEPLLAEATTILQRCRNVSERVAIYCKQHVGVMDAFGEEIKSLTASLQAVEKNAAALDPAESRQQVAERVREARTVLQGVGPGGDLRRFLRVRHPALLDAMLGSKVNVLTHHREQSVAMKAEYHNFRDRAALIMLAGPGLLLYGIHRANAMREGGVQKGLPGGVLEMHSLSPPLMTCMQAYLAWLLYFYCSMALRENVLLVNGSNIRAWWIQHHYWSITICLLLLTCPIDSTSLSQFVESYLGWSIGQALVMMMQNRYQRRHMYRLVALGKTSAVDVVSGETSGGDGELIILYPMIFLLQMWEFVIGVNIAIRTCPAFLDPGGWLDQEAPASDLRGSRTICIVSCLFAYVAVRNCYSTMLTLVEKRKRRAARLLAAKGCESKAD